MKLMAPDYYVRFRCIAGLCKHSCCKGWEIDVDADTLDLYRQIPGKMGHRLQESIDQEQGCFILDGEERCPFLNREGLCDIILELGEEALCQICADHPRFRNELSGRVEIGLGLCCEAAGEMILSQKDPVRMTVVEDDGQEEEEDEAFLAWREKLFAIAQKRSLPVDERVEQVLSACGISMQVDKDYWAEFMLALERLEEGWTAVLEGLKKNTEKELDDQWDIPFEQLLVYLLYRHLAPSAEDGDMQGRTAYACLMWKLLRRMFRGNDLSELVELARLYSAEIEYSDENIGLILDEIHRLWL